MSIEPMQKPRAERLRGWVPFALGFRPFFLLAGLGALVLMAVWLVRWSTPSPAPDYYGLTGWHAHEMLFGYTVAVIAGFLLTAVRNWTGIPTPVGTPLAVLALLWLLGRVLAALPVPPALVAAVDLSFLPALALALARPLTGGENKVNRWFIPLLLAMALANGLVHAEALGLTGGTAGTGTRLMVDLVMLLLVWVAGRVMPFFTERAISGANPRVRAPVEVLTFTLLLLMIPVNALMPTGPVTALLALGFAVLQLARAWGWHDPRVWRIPILWVLYTGYLWLVVGFTLRAAGAMGLFPGNLALHGLTAGTIGVITLGMMARVARGHTGRDIQPPRWFVIGFVCINGAALVRVFAPVIMPAAYEISVLLAGALWLFSFLLFTAAYGSILLRPRADGRPD